jgi:hypothetical protein
MALITPIGIIGGRDRVDAIVQQSNQAVRISVRQRAQENSVHDAEDRSICADAERERQDRNGRENWRVQQIACPISQVSEALLDPDESAGFAVQLSCLLHASEGATGRPPGFFRG